MDGCRSCHSPSAEIQHVFWCAGPARRSCSTGRNTSWLLGDIRPRAAVLLGRNGPGLLTFTDLLELLRKICLENCNETSFVPWQLKQRRSLKGYVLPLCFWVYQLPSCTASTARCLAWVPRAACPRGSVGTAAWLGSPEGQPNVLIPEQMYFI